VHTLLDPALLRLVLDELLELKLVVVGQGAKVEVWGLLIHCGGVCGALCAQKRNLGVGNIATEMLDVCRVCSGLSMATY
jgi:hypothetical protein